MRVPRHPAWDQTFLECTMDDIEETLTDALKSRRAVFEARITIRNLRGEVITITVRKER